MPADRNSTALRRVRRRGSCDVAPLCVYGLGVAVAAWLFRRDAAAVSVTSLLEIVGMAVCAGHRYSPQRDAAVSRSSCETYGGVERSLTRVCPMENIGPRSGVARICSTMSSTMLRANANRG